MWGWTTSWVTGSPDQEPIITQPPTDVELAKEKEKLYKALEYSESGGKAKWQLLSRGALNLIYYILYNYYQEFLLPGVYELHELYTHMSVTLGLKNDTFLEMVYCTYLRK